ncbi:hypothetical protein DFH28DRAFT_884396 [Melampsora americana]|nr:hypothetical protein DFH28DRAFT_884396 [Melampsora americana]
MSSKTNVNTESIMIDSGEEDEGLDRAPKSKDKQNEYIVIESSEEDERPAQSSKNVQNTKLAKPKAPKRTDVLSLCPASTPDMPCDCCKVEKIGGDKVFCCHCGVKPKTLKQGRTEKAVEHWKTGKFFIFSPR